MARGGSAAHHPNAGPVKTFKAEPFLAIGMPSEHNQHHRSDEVHRLAVAHCRIANRVANQHVSQLSDDVLLIDDYSAKHGQWVLSQSFMSIGEGKLFAPGNLRATKDNKGYEELFNYWYVLLRHFFLKL